MQPLAPTQTEPDDADLFAVMATQDRDPDAAGAAWAELHLRHDEYLYRCVRNAFGWRFNYNDHNLYDIVEETIERAHRWAGQHQSVEAARKRFQSDSPDGSLRRFRAWLGKTAQNVALDKLRKSPPSTVDVDEFDVASSVSSEIIDESELAPIIICVRKAFQLLSTSDQEALRACIASAYDAETGRFDSKAGEIVLIASALNMSVGTLRTRRHRALLFIRTCLEAEGFGDGHSGDES